jgi:hypothetical protein
VRSEPARYLSPGHPQRRPFLRTARLNAVGAAALVGVCLVAGVLTAFALQATGWPWPVRAAVGPVVVLISLIVADRRRWAGMQTSFGFTDDAAETRRVADLLVAGGLPVSVDEDDWGSSLRYRNRDAARVHAALRELGITTF